MDSTNGAGAATCALNLRAVCSVNTSSSSPGVKQRPPHGLLNRHLDILRGGLPTQGVAGGPSRCSTLGRSCGAFLYRHAEWVAARYAVNDFVDLI